jgi:heat shock protein HtpX
LTVVTRLLGVDRFLTANGLNLGSLLAFSAVIGFGGATISLRTQSSPLGYLLEPIGNS